MFLEGGAEEGDWDELDFALQAVPIPGGREEPVAEFTGGRRGKTTKKRVGDFVRDVLIFLSYRVASIPLTG